MRSKHVDPPAVTLAELERDPTALTALHLAAAAGRLDVVELLLQLGADPRAERRNRFTPLHAAAMNGQADVCRRLLTAGASVNAQTMPQGYSALHSAAWAGHLATIRVLLAHRANPLLANHRGETPAETAERTGQRDAWRLLYRTQD